MSLPLFDHLPEIEAGVRNAEAVFLALDFDGTLAPIVKDADAARMPDGTKEILRKLSGLPFVTTLVISGRSLEDVTQRVGLNLIYAGNHGLEIRGMGLQYRHSRAEALRPALRRICAQLSRQLSHIGGAFVEDKRLTASVHFRRVAARNVERLSEMVHATLEPHQSEFVVKSGNKVFEIRPRVRWHKGMAALEVRRRAGKRDGVTICVGDDATDEDLFASFPDSISVHVGCDGASRARFCVRNTAAVRRFLRWLLDALTVRRTLQCESSRSSIPRIGIRTQSGR